MGEQRAVHSARELDEPVVPRLTFAERRNRRETRVENLFRHQVDQLLLRLDVPVQPRRMHAEVTGETPETQAIEALLIQHREGSPDDLSAALADGVVSSVT